MSLSSGGARTGAPTLKDGEALDKLIDRGERWARTYRQPDDLAQATTDYDEKFRDEAERLASQCTPSARPFGTVDWISAVLVWLIVAGIVLAGSVLLMRPTPLWFWIFVGVAVAIFVIGVAYVYYDTTNERHVAKKHAQKAQWLLDASRRQSFRVLEGRRS